MPMQPGHVAVKFVKAVDGHPVGEVSAVPVADADKYVSEGIAAYVGAGKPAAAPAQTRAAAAPAETRAQTPPARAAKPKPAAKPAPAKKPAARRGKK